MNSIKIELSETMQEKVLAGFLREIDNDFKPRLSSKLNLEAYSEKLLKNAVFFIAKIDDKTVGLAALYCNDENKKNAYIPVIGTTRCYRGKGVGSELMSAIFKYLDAKDFEVLSLETWEGSNAEHFYKSKGFIVEAIVADRPNGGNSIKLRKRIKHKEIVPLNFIPTPLEYKERISKDLAINLYVKRDDLFPHTGGGSKARKLCYILGKAKEEGYNAVVTAGSNQSNHVRSTALHASALGWKSIIVIHDEEPLRPYVGNLKVTKLAGAELRFVKHIEVKEAMDRAMVDLKSSGLKPLYIWGGGHSVEGAYAYYKAVHELKGQLMGKQPDFIVVASGTGTTQAGIEVGIREVFPSCKVLGISISREQERGSIAIQEAINWLLTYLNRGNGNSKIVFFDDVFVGEGYGKSYPELINIIEWAGMKEGLVLDPTYTGKAFYGLKRYIEDGTIQKGANVVFWHTGGLLNLMASKEV